MMHILDSSKTCDDFYYKVGKIGPLAYELLVFISISMSFGVGKWLIMAVYKQKSILK